jgi:DNA-binding NtrC family response regulator
MKGARIFVANADRELWNTFQRLLQPKGFELQTAKTPPDVSTAVLENRPDLVISCSDRRAVGEGLKISRDIRTRDRAIPIVFVTRFSSERLAIAALRVGVSDYLKAPFSDKSLLACIRRHLPQPNPATGPADWLDRELVGKSRSMRDVKNYLGRVASTDSTVLITGETGTGKELAASLIHRRSRRHDRPFVPVNCAALPENLVESELFGFERGAFTGAVTARQGKFITARGGSLFLDEIGEMNAYAQAKILRSLESKEVYPLGGMRAVPVNVRIMAATNKEPESLMAVGKFRQDLFYRLNVARVHLPPLRERKEDIPALVSHAIGRLNRHFRRTVEGLTDEAMHLLLRYQWPGNVRELMNLLEATYINLPASRIDYADLPRIFRSHLAAAEHLPGDERTDIVTALLETNWNRSSAAQRLNWSRMTLYRKMSKYNIVEKRYPPR